MEFYMGRLGHNMDSGRKKGDRFIGLGNTKNHYFRQIAALTYKEIRNSIIAGTVIGILIPIVQGLLH